jgi:hypothetical protein
MVGDDRIDEVGDIDEAALVVDGAEGKLTSSRAFYFSDDEFAAMLQALQEDK